ncbi:MAG: hypothetical protein ACRERE_33505, partial [Candidatus Entotheonellia bacterium]
MPETPVDFAGRWRPLRAASIAGSEAWRRQHPTATRRAIEAAVDARWAARRARMRQDVALASRATEVRHGSWGERPVWPRWGTVVEPRGPRERQVTTHQGKPLRCTRSSGRCPICQVGVCPPRGGVGVAARAAPPTRPRASGPPG